MGAEAKNFKCLVFPAPLHTQRSELWTGDDVIFLYFLSRLQKTVYSLNSWDMLFAFPVKSGFRLLGQYATRFNTKLELTLDRRIELNVHIDQE